MLTIILTLSSEIFLSELKIVLFIILLGLISFEIISFELLNTICSLKIFTPHVVEPAHPPIKVIKRKRRIIGVPQSL